MQHSHRHGHSRKEINISNMIDLVITLYLSSGHYLEAPENSISTTKRNGEGEYNLD